MELRTIHIWKDQINLKGVGFDGCNPIPSWNGSDRSRGPSQVVCNNYSEQANITITHNLWGLMFRDEGIRPQVTSRTFWSCLNSPKNHVSQHKRQMLRKEFRAIVALLKLLLTTTVEDGRFWEATRSSESQEISHILRNPNVHYCIHKIPSPTVHILSQIRPVQAPVPLLKDPFYYYSPT